MTGTHWTDTAGGLAAGASYATSVCLVSAADMMRYLDQHAAAFGVLLGVATFLVNCYFRWLQRRDRLRVLNGIDPAKRRADDEDY